MRYTCRYIYGMRAALCAADTHTQMRAVAGAINAYAYKL